MPDFIIGLSYLGIFLWFAGLEQFTPIPEEVSLMSIGYISTHEGLNPFFCSFVAIAGLLSFDNALFWITLKSPRPLFGLNKKIKGPLGRKMRQQLSANTIPAIFVASLIPKVRFFVPVIASLSGVHWKQFFLASSAATLCYSVVYVLLGIFFHDQIQAIWDQLQGVQNLILILILITVALYILIPAGRIFYRKNKSKKSR